MNVAVINLFDPLPGESLREGRYGAFCRALVEAGHVVHWYSSDFSHAIKRPRDIETLQAAAARAGYRPTLAPSRPYRTNVSLARLWSHQRMARCLAKMWAVTAERPEAILVSLPPPVIGWAAARWARRCGAALVVDVQDLWPETFRRFWPPGLGWLNPLAFAGMHWKVRAACRQAAAVVGAARGYTDEASRWTLPGTPVATLHLGVDLAAFDAAVRPLGAVGIERPSQETWVFLGGTLSAYVHWQAALDMMAELNRRGRRDVHLVVVGTGPAEAPMRQEAARRGLANVRFLGQQPYEVFASVAAASDIGLVPVRPEALVLFPNRVFDYFAAGLPVVSTIGGELAEVLACRGAGVTCEAVGPALADAVERLPAGRQGGSADHGRRRGDWVDAYDRRHIAAEMVRLLESVVAWR